MCVEQPVVICIGQPFSHFYHTEKISTVCSPFLLLWQVEYDFFSLFSVLVVANLRISLTKSHHKWRQYLFSFPIPTKSHTQLFAKFSHFPWLIFTYETRKRKQVPNLCLQLHGNKRFWPIMWCLNYVNFILWRRRSDFITRIWYGCKAYS